MKEPNQFEDLSPGRLSSAELRAMALRQQQQIDSQHQLLAAKEQRLRFLRAQEARGAATAAEGERLRRLRERVEAQESKLRRLRALRGQVDIQKNYNVTLSNDLDSIRALFSEKEKELSLAVAKVEALTKQLEELRKDRRGINLISNSNNSSNGNSQPLSPAARELEKLRRELMYRNQLSLQQDARLHLQREALQQRQAELRSVDQRILELQGRLQRKKAANSLLEQQLQQNSTNVSNFKNQQSNNIHVRSSSTHIYTSQKNVRGNIAAVEPYNHTPQKSTTNEQQHQQIIQDLAIFKLKSKQQQHQQQQQQQLHQMQHSPTETGHIQNADSDELKLVRNQKSQQQQQDIDNESKMQKFLNSSNHHPPPLPIVMNNNNQHSDSSIETNENQKMPSSDFIANGHLNLANNSNSSNLLSHKIVSSVMSANVENNKRINNECDSDTSEKLNGMQIANSTPLNAIVSKSIAEPFTSNTDANTEEKKPTIKPKALHHQISLGNHVVAVPPRKPISSVAPTSIKPKVGLVAPINNNNNSNNTQSSDTIRPALPPKPAKNNNTHTSNNDDNNNNNHTASNETDNVIAYNEINLPIKAKPLTIKKQPLSEQPRLKSANVNTKNIQYTTSRRIEMPPAFLFPEVVTAELRDTCNDDNIGSGINQSSIISKLINGAINLTNNTDSNGNHDSASVTSSSNDETDKSATATPVQDEKISVESVVKRKRNLTGDDVKAKLARRVSFDPLALLLDASLEGELELVKKTAMQVPNPSAANDEGITALHNAICAGHLEIVKFLVNFGCDVNAQDSDGWTPLHCAASCNNLPMVRFLVETGACLFASTLSDHETPAEKCEEDEEGFDGCSEYLYNELNISVNDKLTILRKGDESEREWWWARKDDREGYVPRNLLGLYPRVEPTTNRNFSD
ncbi:hypothetical protein PVAND_011487 [Polypedilum vanderplanki]|uniref:SH3 domain-containing protein n=1 Tax=Polypedilum vanderplanki TaxID=319348 RepID=A0A9J6CJD4_POLVA|nr:hypothetical protein PVAND_011487 [Polypedilum vanderplanki]